MYFAASQRLTHKGAQKIAASAIASAQRAGIAIAVAVADAGGHLIVLERMDGGRFHTCHSATTKATCAASNKRPTSAAGAQGQALDAAHAIGLSRLPRVRSGGPPWRRLPAIVDNECIGGVGVSGGDWETDARIAREAIETIGAKWT